MQAFLKRLFVSGVLLLATVGLPAALPSLAAADPTPAPTATPVLTLAGTPQTVTAGTPATLVANLGIPLTALQLSSMSAGSSGFAPLASLTTASDGSVSLAVSPQLTTTYRVEFAGDEMWASASAETVVSVRPRLQLTATAAVYEGQSVVFGVQVSPAHPAAAVTLELKGAAGWRPWRTLTLSAASKARFSWPTDRRGRFAFRVSMAADSEHVAGASATRTVTIKDPNPYHIPKAPAHFIVVDISQYLLYYCQHGRIVRVFACVTGKPSTPTPKGHFKIFAKHPHTTGEYGPRLMSYHRPYAIHGTNQPGLLKRFPRNYSHGCTRLSNGDIIWLYAHCPVGTPVWNVP